jgi:hypothetical protein
MGERLVRFKGIDVAVLNVFVIKILEGVKELNHLTIKGLNGIMVNVLVDEYYGKISCRKRNQRRIFSQT